MPTPLTHALVGAALAQAVPSGCVPRRTAVVTFASLAVLPDADIITFRLGISYSDMLGHRGLSHSIIFAVVMALVASMSVLRNHRPRNGLGILVFTTLATLAALSHGILDAATSGGLGVGFLLPFTDERFFLPIRPIVVSPIHPYRFIERAVTVLASEIRWVWTPLIAVSVMYQSGRRLASRRNRPISTG